MPKPVVIIGAGLAGLALARELHQAGVYYLLLDAEDRPGGRLKTDVVDGFKLDRGFQVYLSGYQIASRVLDLEALNLGNFGRGAILFDGSSSAVLAEPRGFLAKLKFLKSSPVPIADLKKFSGWCSYLANSSVYQLGRLPDVPAGDFLKSEGFSEVFIDKFCRPFFGGIFLDRSLRVSSRQLAFVAKMFAEGPACLPADGMQAIPNQLAEDLPAYLFRWGSRVESVLTSKGRAVGVRLDTSEEIEAEAVVIATDAVEAIRLGGLKFDAGSNHSICLYFEAPYEFDKTGLLALNGSEQGIVNHVAALTAAQPSYAPLGKHLAAATILGDSDRSDEELAEIAKTEIDRWLPGKGVNLWRFIRAYRVANAQLPQRPGWRASQPRNEAATKGLYFAGEYTTNSSIDGAIESGLACAQTVLNARNAEAVA